MLGSQVRDKGYVTYRNDVRRTTTAFRPLDPRKHDSSSAILPIASQDGLLDASLVINTEVFGNECQEEQWQSAKIR